MEILVISIIVIITFISRAMNLLNIPIFTDEAIYIRWAQIGLVDPAQRYIALSDGKQPLLTWLMYPTLSIFSDPLFAGRIVSVISSVFTVIGLYLTARELFGRKTAIFSSILYIISPFTLIYDRLALMDSLLATFGIWSLYFQILLIRNPRLDVSLLLGISIGFGTLTKSSAIFYSMLLPFSLLLIDKNKKKLVNRLSKWAILSILSIFISQLMYNSLRLSPLFYIIEQKNYSFILSVQEFMNAPFALLFPNLNGLVSILISYLAVPIFITLLLGLVWSTINRNLKVIFLLFWFLFPFLALAAFGKVIFPRFILFMVTPLFIIVGLIVSQFFDFAYHKFRFFLIIIPIILAFPMYQSYLVLTSPVDVNIHKIDRNQLFDDWPSGYGVKEVISYLEEKASKEKIVIGTEGTFGLNPAVYEIYLGNNQNVEIYGFWPVGEVPPLLLTKAEEYPTYLIFKETQKVPDSWPLKLISKYKRGKGKTYLLFYQLVPDERKEA